ncbi:uncharacterized protein LOC132063004 [Lycium ferocissimum]|uniref:uncharacterized protein LOC132063004 n=1 Tax=Lycium ferocissimum TaxID=112874 RepID=UPI002814C97D|nr:uncharacterized protein LOC132063004 [Lycium ferocissimum]
MDEPKYAVVPAQFRPSSCCNVLYKTITKMICGRLKETIRLLVAENQAAFVQGRSLVPYYFVQLIMTCMTSPYFTVKVNGDGHGFFAGKRWLMQGDLMSLLLFVLVMKYLSIILKTMSDLPDFKFHPMCKHQKLTHSVFADDLMIFCKGNKGSVLRVVEALKHFSSASGLIANMDKSSSFMAGVDDGTRQSLLEVTGFSRGAFPIKYLGLSLSPKKWNKLDCNVLIAKITDRIRNGYSKQLSYAGRLQIINVVLLSIHNFWVQCSSCPKVF